MPIKHSPLFYQRKAFTLIELLVVIAIIGILSTLAIIALNSSRAGARDSKRLADLKNISTALELYYDDNVTYPASLTPGQPLSGPDGTVYLATIPYNPTPRNDGGCPNQEYRYFFTGGRYVLTSCLGAAAGTMRAGGVVVSPAGMESVGVFDSLLAYWKFDEGSGITAYDISGNGYHGTLQGGMVWNYTTNCLFGSCARFNGTDSYIQIPTLNLGTGDFTLVFFVRYGGSNSALPGILGGSSTGAMNIRTSSGAIHLRDAVITISPTLTNQERYTLAVVRQSQTNGFVYVNGVLNGSTTSVGSGTINDITKIGAYKESTFFNGRFDEMRVYSRALTATEIASISATQ